MSICIIHRVSSLLASEGANRSKGGDNANSKSGPCVAIHIGRRSRWIGMAGDENGCRSFHALDCGTAGLEPVALRYVLVRRPGGKAA